MPRAASLAGGDQLSAGPRKLSFVAPALVLLARVVSHAGGDQFSTGPHKLKYFHAPPLYSCLGLRCSLELINFMLGHTNYRMFAPPPLYSCLVLSHSLVVISFLPGHTNCHLSRPRPCTHSSGCLTSGGDLFPTEPFKLSYFRAPPLYSRLGLPHLLVAINLMLGHANYHLSRPRPCTHSSSCLTLLVVINFILDRTNFHMFSLHKERKTSDAKQETGNTDGKQETRSAEEHFEILKDL